jgi:hypothetical protein
MPVRGRAGKLALFCRSLLHVRFTITPFRQSTCPFRCSGGNWLCLAQSLPGRPRPFLGARAKLGLFRTIRHRRIGFVLRISPSGAPAGQPNWLRFAHSSLVPEASSRPAGPELGSFCAFRPVGLRLTSQIGFVSHNWPCRIGFVLYDGFPDASQASKLALFCTSHFTPQTSDFSQLGSFCAFGSLGARPTSQLGLFRTRGPAPRPGRAGTDWLCSSAALVHSFLP